MLRLHSDRQLVDSQPKIILHFYRPINTVLSADWSNNIKTYIADNLDQLSARFFLRMNGQNSTKFITRYL